MEEVRQDKEEQLWQSHEQHVAEIDRERELVISLERDQEDRRLRAQEEAEEERQQWEEQRTKCESEVVNFVLSFII